jgi:hypothetical protein
MILPMTSGIVLMSLSLAPADVAIVNRPTHQPVTAHFRLLHVRAGDFEVGIGQKDDHGMQPVEVHFAPHRVAWCGVADV